jgi:hypothetical protein
MTGLGIAGFVLSIVALLWNVGMTWVRWPRVSVVIRQTVTIGVQAVGGGLTDTTDLIRLVVINRGSEAMTIGSVGLIAPDGSRSLDYESLEKQGQPLPKGDPLPARIEGHGCLVWEFDESMLTAFPNSARIDGYADRFTPFRKWPKRWRSSTKRTRTVVATYRNGGQPQTPDAPTPS